MDIIVRSQDTAIPRIHGTVRTAFPPHLEQHRAEIEGFRSQTFKYGVTDRHCLDVYYPPADNSPAPISKNSVLFFIYGGGFFEGDRKLVAPHDLVYTNLGAYFARRGFLTIIPNYRLVPHAKFPEPVEDIRDAIAWVMANVETVLAGAGAELGTDFDHVFLMGHSAGSTYVSTLLLYDAVLPPSIRSRIRGVILKGGTYAHKREETTNTQDPRIQLYGSWDEILDKMPLTLLQRTPAEDLRSMQRTGDFPEVIIFVSEREPEGFRESSEEFKALWESKLGKEVPLIVMKDHNHLSPHWALWTGAGEEWAEDVVKWVKSQASKV